MSQAEQKEQSLQKVLYGKKTILFPMVLCDLDNFVRIHRDDKDGYLGEFCLKKMTDDEAKQYVYSLFLQGNLLAWTMQTKEGKKSRIIGFIYLSDISEFSAMIGGSLDKDFLKGITKRIKGDKLTYSEDSLRALLDHAFNGFNLKRIYANILKNNRRSILLSKKVGFIEEGVMRKSFKVDENYFDVVILSILKEEWKNEI